MTGAGIAPREATPAEVADWDRLTVHVPGGHVYQSRTWAEQRSRLGWVPLHVMLGDDHGALVLTRRVPWVGSLSAYIPRGPVSAGDRADRAAARVVALTDWLARRGVDVVATDAEIPASDAAYGRALAAAHFHPIPEIQPSRHRVSLLLAPDADDAAIRAGLTKSTRQRIAAAEREGIVVTRHDTAGWTGSHPPFVAPASPLDAALAGFADLLEATGARRGFRFGPRDVFLDWWRAAHDAGLLVYLEAHLGTTDEVAADRVLGGLILYRHGGRLSTVHSADTPAARDAHPGVMHLLRWRAIQLAIRERAVEMDLGGVDTAPDHREPVAGDAMAGLYEHKRSFGARWVEMTGARERVIRPWRYGLGRAVARVARLLPGGRG
jgi:lipid II:glycine glycyltransferase (peptidoglycan interpeptide bridge formation enzyme)